MFNVSDFTINSTQSLPLGTTLMPPNHQQYNEPWFFWFRIILITALMLCVIVGNLMVLYCLSTVKELQTVTGVFLTSLAVTDLGVGFTAFPLALAANIDEALTNRRWFCVVQGISSILFIIASLLTLGVLSLFKYINICYSLQKRFSKRHAKYATRGVWLIAVVLAIAPAFGWSKYARRTGAYHCSPYDTSASGYVYSILMVIIGFIMPCITMLYCYCKLYMMMHSHVRRMRVNDIANTNTTEQNLSSVESHLINTLIIMVMALFICWIPALIFYILNFAGILVSNIFSSMFLICILGTSAVNPIVYVMREKAFQKGFRRIIRRIFLQV